MRTMKNTLLSAGAAIGLASAGAVQANVVDIQFQGVNNSSASFSGKQGAYTGDGVPAPTWNVLNGMARTTTSGSMSNLVASDGTATTDAVSFTSTGSFSSAPNSNNLTQAYIVSSGANNAVTSTVTLTGLVSNGEYQLYLYGSNGYYNSRSTTFSITTGSGSPVSPSTATSDSALSTDKNLTFVENTNYVVFNATASNTGTLGIGYAATAGSGQYEGDFNGLQVIAAPEPASIGLVALGGLGILLMPRRRRTA